MVNILHLRGNELIIYALIYGFSQNTDSSFQGSLTYIQDRTGLSRPTVVDILKKLIDKKLIVKDELFRNNLKICTYRCSKETLLGVVKFLNKGSKETLPPILYNTKDNKNNNSQVDEDIKIKVSEILKYLNFKTNKNFRLEAKTNREPIEARLCEGYEVKDFKYVIDIKTSEWINTDMNQWLNPQTLFRPKNFERYLNQKSISKGESKQEEIEVTW